MTSVQADRVALWSSCVAMASSLARRRAAGMPWQRGAAEDLRQDALAALWEATATWDPAGGRAFPGHAYVHVRGAVHRAAWSVQFWGFNGNRAAYQKGAALPARVARGYVGNSPEPGEPDDQPAGGPDGALEAADLVEHLLKAARPGAERDCVRGHYLCGLDRDEIAARSGLSRHRVDQAIQAGLRRMRARAGVAA